MTTRFTTFLPFLYKWECVRDKNGNVIAEHDPDDSGGTTKYGIDQSSHPHEDIERLTEARARQIYFDEWTACGAESMRAKLGEVYFNACVNCGTGRARKLLAKSNDSATFLDAQDDFYRALAESKPKCRKWLRGWLNRTADLRKFLSL